MRSEANNIISRGYLTSRDDDNVSSSVKSHPTISPLGPLPPPKYRRHKDPLRSVCVLDTLVH